MAYRVSLRAWDFSGNLRSFVAGGAVVLAYGSLYPILSINTDYTFDTHNPYNASFSVTNEGYAPAYDLSATCVSTFEYVTPPDAKVAMGQLTTTTNERVFARILPSKQRASIPCNSNPIANGHPIMPGAKLKFIVHFRLLGLIPASREFNQYAVLWWDNTYRWQMGTPDASPPGTITVSGSNVHYTGR